MSVSVTRNNNGITATVMCDGDVLSCHRGITENQFKLIVEALRKLTPFVLIENY